MQECITAYAPQSSAGEVATLIQRPTRSFIDCGDVIRLRRLPDRGIS